MRILILRYTDQPAVNICKNMAAYSKHGSIIMDRNYSNLNGFDVVFYYNVNDIMKDDIYRRLKNSDQKICVGAQSWRLLLEPGWLEKFRVLNNVVGVCSPSKLILAEVIKQVDKDLVYKWTPFSADTELFKETQPIRLDGKLRVGYVGTFREDKKYLEVVKPAFDALKDEIELVIYGRAGGKKLPINRMCEAYNEMDCLVIGSKYESGPMVGLEAALCSRMTISTDCGFMKEAFDEKSAIFIDHSSDSLIAAIRKILNNREFCVILGKNAYKRVKSIWNWETLIKMQDDFFEAVYNEKD